MKPKIKGGGIYQSGIYGKKSTVILDKKTPSAYSKNRQIRLTRIR